MVIRLGQALGLAVVSLLFGGLDTAIGQSPAPEPSGSHGSSAVPSSSVAPLPSEVVVTFQVVDEQFRALVRGPDNVANAYALLEGRSTTAIPVATVLRGDPGVNEPWTWQMDPETFAWAGMTVEVCDGLPSHVEAGTITSDQYCPWSAQVISVEPAEPAGSPAPASPAPMASPAPTSPAPGGSPAPASMVPAATPASSVAP